MLLQKKESTGCKGRKAKNERIAMFNMNPVRWEAVIAFCWTLIGILTGLYGGGFRDVEVSNWAGWLIAFIGAIIFFICIRAIMRGDDKKSKVEYTDEDAAQGLQKLEMMYLKEYGVLPDYPEKAEMTANKDREQTDKD